MSLDHFTASFADFLKENSQKLIKFSHFEGMAHLSIDVVDTHPFYAKTSLFVNTLLESKRVDLDPYYGKGVTDDLLVDINTQFHEAIFKLANEKKLTAYISGLR